MICLPVVQQQTHPVNKGALMSLRRPAIPLGKAASLTRAMSISRSGSVRRALPASDELGSGSPAAPSDGTLAPPPPLSAAAAAAAAAAVANATHSSGGSGSTAGRCKKLGRPIAFQGDINSHELTEAERRHIRRWGPTSARMRKTAPVYHCILWTCCEMLA